jgi:hypothetical protein
MQWLGAVRGVRCIDQCVLWTGGVGLLLPAQAAAAAAAAAAVAGVAPQEHAALISAFCVYTVLGGVGLLLPASGCCCCCCGRCGPSRTRCRLRRLHWREAATQTAPQYNRLRSVCVCVCALHSECGSTVLVLLCSVHTVSGCSVRCVVLWWRTGAYCVYAGSSGGLASSARGGDERRSARGGGAAALE